MTASQWFIPLLAGFSDASLPSMWMATLHDPRYLEFRSKFPEINDNEAKPCYLLRQEIRQFVETIPKGRLGAEIPAILQRINIFVGEKVELAAVRLPVCGFIHNEFKKRWKFSVYSPMNRHQWHKGWI
jgi:hypothetical protein